VVYLPQAGFAQRSAPALPTVITLGGDFDHADDWFLSTTAPKTLDTCAELHHRNAPVVGFPDIASRFDNDECVDGSLRNAAPHFTRGSVSGWARLPLCRNGIRRRAAVAGRRAGHARRQGEAAAGASGG
jgi:hypothetical protein